MERFYQRQCTNNSFPCPTGVLPLHTSFTAQQPITQQTTSSTLPPAGVSLTSKNTTAEQKTTSTPSIDKQTNPTAEAPQALAELILSFVPTHAKPKALELTSAIPNKTHADIAALLLLSPQELRVAVAHLRLQRWSSSTAVAKLGILEYLHRILAHAFQLPATLRLTLATLKREQLSTRKPAWDPSNLTLFCPATTVHTWHTDHAPRTIPARLAWLTGQRIGDVLLWRPNYLFEIQIQDHHSLAQLVVEGKTVASTGPYALHLPPNGPAADLLREATALAIKQNRAYTFLNTTIELPKADAIRAALKLEKELKDNECTAIDLRAIRRGGLSTMTFVTGAEPEKLQRCSRHKSTETLRIYQGAGLLDLNTARVQQALVSANESALLSPEIAEVTIAPWVPMD